VTATATLGALDPFTVELTRGSTPLGTQAQLGDLVTVTPADDDVSGASATTEC
jgi:hypothetical protein